MEVYKNPPIPKGFVHVSGTWDKAFIIEDVKSKNRFTWIPLGVSDEISKQLETYMYSIEGRELKFDFMKGVIDLHKGIYISTYPISKSNHGKAISSSGNVWNNVSFKLAKFNAKEMCKEFQGIGILTRLLYEVEYEMVVDTISYLLKRPEVKITTKQFEEFGLYGMNDFWTWTLTNYTEYSMVIKKADSKKDTVYANNDSFESPAVGFRVALIVF